MAKFLTNAQLLPVGQRHLTNVQFESESLDDVLTTLARIERHGAVHETALVAAAAAEAPAAPVLTLVKDDAPSDGKKRGLGRPRKTDASDETKGDAVTSETKADAAADPVLSVAPEVAAPVVQRSDIERAMTEFARKHGVPKAAELLRTFGAARIPALKTEQYPAVLAAIKADGVTAQA